MNGYRVFQKNIHPGDNRAKESTTVITNSWGSDDVCVAEARTVEGGGLFLNNLMQLNEICDHFFCAEQGAIGTQRWVNVDNVVMSLSQVNFY